MNKFVSESEIAEKRRVRQEEWEKVRKAEDPVEAPEPDEAYDPRSLYDRLQEQKDKKQSEFEESIKFKNQFRGIDKTEAEFLDMVSDQASKLEKQKKDAVEKELNDFRAAVRTVRTIESKEVAENVPKSLTVPPKKSSNKQVKLLQSGIKRKITTAVSDGGVKKSLGNSESMSDSNDNKGHNVMINDTEKMANKKPLLTGLVSYDSDENSSESESS